MIVTVLWTETENNSRDEKEAEYVKKMMGYWGNFWQKKKKARTLQQPDGNLTGNETKKVLVGETGKIMHVKTINV